MSTRPTGVYEDFTTSGVVDGTAEEVVSDFPARRAAMSTFVGW